MSEKSIHTWNHYRKILNKALVISAVVIVTIITAILYFIFNEPLTQTYILTLLVVLVLYIGTVNVVLFLLEFCDRMFSLTFVGKHKSILFKILFAVAITIPLAYLIMFVYGIMQL